MWMDMNVGTDYTFLFIQEANFYWKSKDGEEVLKIWKERLKSRHVEKRKTNKIENYSMNINSIKSLVESYKHEIKLRLVSKVACLPVSMVSYLGAA